jgi:hypothetical protein
VSDLELLPQKAVLSLDAELGPGEALDPAASYAQSYGQIKTRVLRTCSKKRKLKILSDLLIVKFACGYQ